MRQRDQRTQARLKQDIADAIAIWSIDDFIRDAADSSRAIRNAWIMREREWIASKVIERISRDYRISRRQAAQRTLPEP